MEIAKTNSLHDSIAPRKEELSTPAVFRSYAAHEFRETMEWRRLVSILGGNGGSYGLYGPRGAGKSWLMLRAIEWARSQNGLGLWFPCPSAYESNAFISALSDNLAVSIERRLVRDDYVSRILKNTSILLTAFIVICAVLDIIILATHHISRAKSAEELVAMFINALSLPLQIVAGLSILGLGFIYAIRLRLTGRTARLAKEASTLRERIRFSESLKFASEVGITAGTMLAASLTRSRERALGERPSTIASLIFDFRNFASLVASELRGPIVIGIDELDKIEDPESVRSLLKDVKGIFEIPGVYFLVSISEEAARALHLGILQPGGRNVFNSSFYTVIELLPLDAVESEQLLRSRGLDGAMGLARILCVLAAGNPRELMRIADSCMTYARRVGSVPDKRFIMNLLADESQAFLQEIIREDPSIIGHEAKLGIWRILSQDNFESRDVFIKFGRTAIMDAWESPWRSDNWLAVQESWRRLLIRFFLAACTLGPNEENAGIDILDDMAAVNNLRDVMLMATNDTGVARQMLQSHFGEDLSRSYNRS
jgi:KAP family P-loop domain